MSAADFSREPLQVVEIIQPLCSRTFGTSPCLATGNKCWNTDATCKFITALSLTSQVLMRFVMPAANRTLPGGFQPGTAIPALISVDTAPTVLNVGAGNEDISPLGMRAVASISIKDFPYNDVGFDPYLADRSYDPVTRGSFWSKWLARNPYHVGYVLRIYDGYFGDELADMIKREYSIEKIDSARSQVRITAKDILRKVTDNDVQAPPLSPGALSLALTIGATSFQVAGAALADYGYNQDNRLLRSEQFNDAAWTNTRSSITANAIAAPDGNLTADKLVEDTTATNTHFVSQTVTIGANQTLTFSCYVRAAERTRCRLSMISGTDQANVNFDLTSVTATPAPVNAAVVSGSEIIDVGGGWFRLSVTGVPSPSGATVGCRIFLLNAIGGSLYTGDGTSGLHVWGAQLSEASSQTSYVQTIGTPVTLGWLRIGSEVMSYTSRAIVSTNVEFTGVARGQLNTQASAHSQFAQVQRVLSYIEQPFSDIIYELLTKFGGIPAVYIDKGAWNAEFQEWRELYRFTGYIADPVSVQRLVGELCQQGLANVWWDERVQKIIFRAQRPNFAPQTLTQESDIVADSFVIEESAKDRSSQVYVYYGLRSPIASLSDKTSYTNAEVFIDVDKERQYGESKVKEIFCRWVQTGVIARTLGSAYLLRFRDVRRHITFNLTAKDIASVWTGDVLQIKHFLNVDFTGAELIEPWLITSAETVEQGGVYRFTAEDNESGGLLWEWVADDDTRGSMEIGAWVDDDGTDGAGNTPPFAWI